MIKSYANNITSFLICNDEKFYKNILVLSINEILYIEVIGKIIIIYTLDCTHEIEISLKL